eukprot:6531513-Alexandrium_andersonii.AAC.1
MAGNLMIPLRKHYSTIPFLKPNYLPSQTITFEPTYANGGKLAVNGFIGMLGKNQLTSTQHYFESNYDVVANGL